MAPFIKTLIIALLLPYLAVSQIITTVAGTGISGYSGDGGPATLAQIPSSAVRAIDMHGNLLITTGGNNRIRMVDASGNIFTIAGLSIAGFSGDGGSATAAKLNYPHDVAVDTGGNIYIADYLNYRIRKIDATTQVISTIAGNGVATSTGDGGSAISASIIPYALCLDDTGNIYFVCDYGTRVRKIDIFGTITTIAGTGVGGYSGDGGQATSANLAMNYGICLDTSNNLYLACDTRVRKVDLNTGIISTFAGTGSVTYTGDAIPATAASFGVFTLCIDKINQVLFVQDDVNDQVYKINDAGMFYLVAGTGVGGYNGDGIAASSAQLFNPEGGVVDACGNLYIGDKSNYRIRKVSFNTTPIATIAITATPNDTICTGTPITLTATTTGGSTEGYQWYKNGTAIAGATNATYTYIPTESDDDIKCVYTGVDICSFSGNPSSNVITIVLTPLTIPTISITAPAAATIGSTITVSATVANAGSSYSIDWYKNSVLFATTTTPTTTYTKTIGADIITTRITSTDATGCYDTTTSAGVTITDAPDGVEDLLSLSTSVHIYPNPAYDLLTITATQPLHRIVITNLLGQVCNSVQTTHRKANISLADLPPGMYLIKVNDRYIQRFTKQ